MRPLRRVFALGGGTSTFLGRGHPHWVSRSRIRAGDAGNPSLEEHLATAIRAALADAGIEAGQIERGWIGNFLGERFCDQGHLGSVMAGVVPGLDGCAFGRVEAACASGGLAITGAAESMQAGWDVVLVAGVEVETHAPGREGVANLALAADRQQAQAMEMNTFPYLFAKRARAYRAATGSTSEDTAAVVVKAYDNASHNPMAQMRAVSVDLQTVATENERNRAFLEDPELRDHMRLLESTTFTDGAAAMVLVTERGLEKLGLSKDGCTELVSWGHRTGAIAAEVDLLEMTTLAAAAADAYRDGGVSADGVDVAEVHDCFAMTEILLYEAMGFAGRGEGWKLAREGQTRRGGRIPVNASGGLLGTGHPVGATGVRQLVDLHRQLTGTAGGQVDGASLGLAANMGGDDRTGVVTIWRAV